MQLVKYHSVWSVLNTAANKKLSYHRRTVRCSMLVRSCYVSRGMQSLRFQSAKVTFKVIQGHCHWCHSIGHIRFPISFPLQLPLHCNVNEISLITQNLKRSRDSEHIPSGDNIIRMHSYLNFQAPNDVS